MEVSKEAREEFAKVFKWYHKLDLGMGVKTPERGDQQDNYEKLKTLNFPDEMSGKNVLDIGCAEGFFTFELAKRGARVLGVENSGRMFAKWLGYCYLLMEDGHTLGDADIVFGNADNKETWASVFKWWKQYDYILALAILHWVHNTEFVLSQMAKACKGVAWVEVVRYDIGKIEYHKGGAKKCIPYGMWPDLFTQAGFNSQRIVKTYVSPNKSVRVLWELKIQ